MRKAVLQRGRAIEQERKAIVTRLGAISVWKRKIACFMIDRVQFKYALRVAL